MGKTRNGPWDRQRRRYVAMKTLWPAMGHVWDQDQEQVVPKPSRDLKRTVRRFLDEGFDRSGISEGTIVHLLAKETARLREFMQLFFRLGLDDKSRRQAFLRSAAFDEVGQLFRDAGRDLPEESRDMGARYVKNVMGWLDHQATGTEDQVRRSELLVQAIRMSPCGR